MPQTKKYKKLYIITDVETTGLDYIYDEVFEIAFLITDGVKIIDTYSSYIRVDETLLSKAITNIGHIIRIDKDAILNARTGKDVYNDCIQMLNKCTQQAQEYKLVAHNISVDYTMTLRSITRSCSVLAEQYKQLFQHKLLDTIPVLKKLYPSLKKYSLSYVVENLHIQDKESLLESRKHEKHSAMLDCQILFLLLKHILKQMIFTNI